MGLEEGIGGARLTVPSLNPQMWGLKDFPQNTSVFQKGRSIFEVWTPVKDDEA